MLGSLTLRLSLMEGRENMVQRISIFSRPATFDWVEEQGERRLRTKMVNCPANESWVRLSVGYVDMNPTFRQ